jgi:hypothetical protein
MDPLVLSLLRAAAAAALATAVAAALARPLAAPSTAARRPLASAVLILLALPWLLPPITVAYTYRPLWLALTSHPLLADLAFTVWQALRLVAPAALARLALPSPSHDSARLALQLADAHPFRQFRRAASTLPPQLGIALALALLAFHDLEPAALAGVRSWSVDLFDAHAGGLPLDQSLAAALPAAVLGLALLLTSLALLALPQRSPIPPATPRPAHASSALALTISLVVAVPGALVPLAILSFNSLPALPQLTAQATLADELAASIIAALLAASLATPLAIIIARRPSLFPLALPGLIAPLPLALAALAAIQSPPLLSIRETWLPLATVQAAILLPLAALLARALLPADPATHAARLARSPLITAAATTRPALLLFLLIFLHAAQQLTAPALLAPIDAPTAALRLHNLMHYGHSHTLSAMALAAAITPALVAIVLYALLATATRLLVPQRP